MFDQDEYAQLPTVIDWMRYYADYGAVAWSIGAAIVWALFL